MPLNFLKSVLLPFPKTNTFSPSRAAYLKTFTKQLKFFGTQKNLARPPHLKEQCKAMSSFFLKLKQHFSIFFKYSLILVIYKIALKFVPNFDSLRNLLPDGKQRFLVRAEILPMLRALRCFLLHEKYLI